MGQRSRRATSELNPVKLPGAAASLAAANSSWSA